MKKLMIAASLSTLLLSGCGLFKSDHVWERAKQERPLEIPQGMDRPDVSDALMIPRVNEHPDNSVSDSTDSLQMSAPVAAAWQSVGKALDEADIGAVAKDEGSHSYRVDLAGTKTKKKKGFFSRLFGGGDDSAASSGPDLSMPHLGGMVTVSVKAAASGGSTVSVEGDGGDVARVAAALRARLGG